MKKIKYQYLNSNTRAYRISCLLLIFTAFCSIQSGCKKFVEVDPPVTSITSPVVYSNNSSAESVLTGIYSQMATSASFFAGVSSMGFNSACAADELTCYSKAVAFYSFYTNSYLPQNVPSWGPLYKYIYDSNAAIAGLTKSTNVSTPIKNQLLGEAKFIRAFLYFYTTNLYGDVPLVTTTNYQVNNTINRTPQAQVYGQIIADLKDAQSLLGTNFVDATGLPTTERIRPNKNAAAALLARVYLYQKNWVGAEAEADTVISNTSLSLINLNAVFLKNSNEAIWQLQVIAPPYYDYDALAYVLTSTPGTGNVVVSMSPQLLSAFESGDQRFTNWVGLYTDPRTNILYYYPYKYKNNKTNNASPTEYTMVLRLGEQYLIRAEARAQQQNLSGAAADLNMIRTRAGLPNTTATTQTDLLTAIQHERQVELFTEWGHRWLDLKRTGNINSVMGSPGNVCQAKGGVWNSDGHQALLPIPISEIQLNSNLTQNPGY